jgi:hypothetical protein
MSSVALPGIPMPSDLVYIKNLRYFSVEMGCCGKAKIAGMGLSGGDR